MDTNFYDYLAKRVVKYFSKIDNIVGQRYSIEFDREDQVENLYKQIEMLDEMEIFNYYDDDNVLVYKTYALRLNDSKIIIAATVGGVTTNFLTKLRNLVGTSKNGFDDAAILLIHNSNLDSIITGTGNFNREGMPFNINEIMEDIFDKLFKSNLSKKDKWIIEFELNNRKKEVVVDNSNIFDYKGILTTISIGKIEKEEYKILNLFYDSKLEEEVSMKKAEKRLGANYKEFKKMDDIHRYENPQQELEKYLDEGGVKKFKTDFWFTYEYEDVLKSIENRKKDEPIQLEDIVIHIGERQLKEDVDFWVKKESDNGKKSRKQHIIIFNSENINENVEIDFLFDKHINKNNNIKAKEKDIAKISYSGKKVNYMVNHYFGKTTIDEIRANDEKLNNPYIFRIAIVDTSPVVLELIKAIYKIEYKNKENKFILISTDENTLTFNMNGNKVMDETFENSREYKIKSNEKLIINNLNKIFTNTEDLEQIPFSLDVDGSNIKFQVKLTNRKIAPISGYKVYKDKREKKNSFKYLGENKLIQGTDEFFARNYFKDNLDYEKFIIENRVIFCRKESGKLINVEIDIDDNVKKSYLNYLDAIKSKGTLPSLAYLDEELISLAKEYVTSVILLLNELEQDEPLTSRVSNISKIGTIHCKDDDEEIMFTPLHPLNVAYQIQLNKMVDKSELSEDIIKKLTSTNLIPYIYKDRELYKVIEQTHSLEWRYYVKLKQRSFNGSRDFVSKLVKEKITEFIDHFGYLFNISNNPELNVNLINTGISKEIFKGIFKYYVEELKNNKSIDELIKINIGIYSNGKILSAFEQFALHEKTEDVIKAFELQESDFGKTNYNNNEIIDMLREKICVFIQNEELEKYEYAHITFYELESNADASNSVMDSIDTGVALNGLLSGIPSVYYGEAYRTGFGTKNMPNDNDLLKLVFSFNAMLRVANNGDPYILNQAITTSIEKDKKNQLDKVYDSTNWVTFIDPKFDLNFFKTDAQNKDLLIIHYSDQFTSTSGYDAITVTRKSKQYQEIIREFLLSQNVKEIEELTPKIINMFNAINGDWLLRLIAKNNQFPREKISILSAVKLALAYYNSNKIVWIPVSLEEIIRVSGSTGLKQSEGFFSAKKLGFKGSASDDILLIGIEEVKGQLKVYFQPIEVKIGNNNPDYLQKGRNQLKHTHSLLMETLLDNQEVDVQKSFYRNFIVQLAIIGAEKMKLYDIWEDGNWDKVVNGDWRRRLQNDDYIISTEMEEVYGSGSLISFKKDVLVRKVVKEDNITLIEVDELDGYNFITKEVGEIIQFLKVELEIEPTKLFKDDDVDTPPDVDEIKTNAITILVGHDTINKIPIYWYPNDTNKIMNPNTGIIGTMGTGKTQFTKSLITQLTRNEKYNLNGTSIGILIFDYKGDYIKDDFVEATGATVYNLYELPINPLAIIQGKVFKHMLPMHTARTFIDTLSRIYTSLGTVQKDNLKDLIVEAYNSNGIIASDPSTWNNSPPTIYNLYEIYINNADIKKDTLKSALSELIDYKIFETDANKTKTIYRLIDGVTVINLNGYPEGIQNLVVALMLDLFYAEMQATGHSDIDGDLRELSKFILVDEADNFLKNDFDSIKKILKEGREFGVGTILSTQFLSHFSTNNNDYAKYLLTWVVHKVNDMKIKDVEMIFNSNDKEDIFNEIKKLEKHYSIVQIGNEMPKHVRDKAFWEL